jgi:serine/threonine protein kinase
MDLVELAFHALQKLQEEGRYSVKDATFKWSEEKGRMVLQILPDRDLDRQNSVNQESTKLQEVCRDLEEKDLTDLIEKLEQLMASEKEKKPFYRGTSSAYEIAKYLSNKLSGPTPVAGAYLPYTFSKIDTLSLKYREYLDIGSSGMVAINDWHKVQVAVKSVRCPIRAKFEEEAAILGMVQHPNVVRLIGCGYIDKSDTGLLVMELMDHDLRYIINSRLKVLPEGSNPFAPIVAIDIMLQIGQAMLYLREHSILHRDLKAKNVLVNLCKPLALQKEADSANTSLMRQSPAVSAVLPHTQENYVAKLADFGLAKCRPQSSYVHTTMVGTTGWRAPEVFNSTDNEAYKWPADVYSFGMLCYEILTGKMPFVDEPDHSVGLHAKIMAGYRPPLASLLRPDVPDALRELIEQCWATNANERPKFETIVKKLWECKVQAILPGFERQIMRTASSSVVT